MSLALNTGFVFLMISTFLASTVEMVEALTIVLAVGVTRQWRSTLIGVLVAILALGALVAVLGPALALIFTLAFKDVFLEGLEVVFIVLTFGANAAADGSGSVALAAWGAAMAIVLVGTTGAVLRHPLSRVPENTMKFGVGAMLTTFGAFWGGEGVGVVWPGQDVAVLAILAATSR